MDEFYRGYRISVRHTGSWTARITAARGSLAPFAAHSEESEGPAVCVARARELVDRYIAFLEATPGGEEP